MNSWVLVTCFLCHLRFFWLPKTQQSGRQEGEAFRPERPQHALGPFTIFEEKGCRSPTTGGSNIIPVLIESARARGAQPGAKIKGQHPEYAAASVVAAVHATTTGPGRGETRC